MRTQEREVPAIQVLGPDTDKAQGFWSYTDTVKSTESEIGRVWSFTQVLKEAHR